MQLRIISASFLSGYVASSAEIRGGFAFLSNPDNLKESNRGAKECRLPVDFSVFDKYNPKNIADAEKIFELGIGRVSQLKIQDSKNVLAKIKDKYNEKVLKYHPDKVSEKLVKKANEIFIKLNVAKDTLIGFVNNKLASLNKKQKSEKLADLKDSDARKEALERQKDIEQFSNFYKSTVAAGSSGIKNKN